MCNGRCRALSLPCVNYTQHPSSCLDDPSSNRLSLLWFSASWTIHWLVYRPISSVDFCRFRTQRRDSYSGSVVPTTSLTLLSVSTGYECRKGSFSRSPCRLARRCMLIADAKQYLRQFTGTAVADVSRFVKDFGLLPQSDSLSIVRLSMRRRAFPVSGAYNGTIYLLTLPPRRLCGVRTYNQRLKMYLFRRSYSGLTFYLFLPFVAL